MNKLVKQAPIYKYLKKNKFKNLPAYLEKELDESNVKLVSDSKTGLIYSIARESDIGKKIIGVDFKCDTELKKNEVKKIIEKVKSFDRRIKNSHFYVDYGGNLHHALEKCGAKNIGNVLYAKVSDGIKAVSNIENANYKIKRPTEEDIEELVNLEYLAHRASLTSRVGHISKKMVRQLYQNMIKRKAYYMITSDGVIVGTVGIAENKIKLGFIMTVAVHPDYQGLGISKLLYKQAFSHWQKKGVQFYSGVSTTTEVLGFAKKLKRTPLKVYLEI